MKQYIFSIVFISIFLFSCSDSKKNKENKAEGVKEEVVIELKLAEEGFLEGTLPFAVLNSYLEIMETEEIAPEFISDSIFLFFNPELNVLTGDNYYYEYVKFAETGDSLQIKLISNLLLEKNSNFPTIIDSLEFDNRFTHLKGMSKEQLTENKDKFTSLAYIRISPMSFEEGNTKGAYFITMNYAGKTRGYLLFGECVEGVWKIADLKTIVKE
jgi:hypothetical protein